MAATTEWPAVAPVKPQLDVAETVVRAFEPAATHEDHSGLNSIALPWRQLL